MKLAISAAGPDLSSAIDQRFGRAPYLLIVDTPGRTVQAIDNRSGANAIQGAGVHAAQSDIGSKATVLITGHCGPKAYRALQAAGVHVYLVAGGTVEEAVSRFEKGELTLARAPSMSGNW